MCTNIWKHNWSHNNYEINHQDITIEKKLQRNQSQWSEEEDFIYLTILQHISIDLRSTFFYVNMQ